MCNHQVAMASIERSIVLDVPAGEVWDAISDERLLSEWLAPEVELDPRPGGTLRCRTEDDEERPGAVRLLEEGERIVFEWRREGAAPSHVDLRIEELDGGTRLTVVESGLRRSTAPQASAGWSKRFESLRLALASFAYA
jgi:uncharacterized protein YndB with AHSA1/START domain